MTDYKLRPHLESPAETLDRLRRAAEAAKIGTFYVPLPAHRIYWNARCKQHFWLPADTPDDAIDMDLFYRSIHQEDRERVRAAVDASVGIGEPYDVEYRTVSPGGDVRWIRAKGSTTFESGRPIRFDGITVDISTQKQLEAERNALISNERMLRLASQSANDAKDAFIAAVSHELRTPLTSILAWVDLLTQGADDPSFVRNGMIIIRRNVLAQTRLVDDLLDASRVSSGKFVLNKANVGIAGCLKAALQDIRPVAERKGVLIADLVADEVEVFGDGPRIRQVFGNLLSNAIKHTEQGGTIVPCVATRGSAVRISIADTGAGIPPDRLNDIFEPFVQIGGATTAGSAGLGLGLAIARSIVVMHGGDITADSAGLGQGSTFTVILPLPGQRLLAEPPLESALYRSALKGKTVLLVEDDADSREALAMVLQLGDATVHTASSAEDADRTLITVTPDAIVSDVGMPGENGYTFMRRLRDQGINVPAVALTGHVRKEDEVSARDAGFDAYLGKPVDPAKWLSVIQRLLGA